MGQIWSRPWRRMSTSSKNCQLQSGYLNPGYIPNGEHNGKKRELCRTTNWERKRQPMGTRGGRMRNHKGTLENTWELKIDWLITGLFLNVRNWIWNWTDPVQIVFKGLTGTGGAVSHSTTVTEGWNQFVPTPQGFESNRDCNVCSDSFEQLVWKEIVLELNGEPSSVTGFSTDFFLPNPGFLEFIWIFSNKNHLKINIPHILNPNLTK
jgi:hypothetical protein